MVCRCHAPSQACPSPLTHFVVARPHARSNPTFAASGVFGRFAYRSRKHGQIRVGCAVSVPVGAPQQAGDSGSQAHRQGQGNRTQTSQTTSGGVLVTVSRRRWSFDPSIGRRGRVGCRIWRRWQCGQERSRTSMSAPGLPTKLRSLFVLAFPATMGKVLRRAPAGGPWTGDCHGVARTATSSARR